jgi:hypothetical protein
LAQPINCMTDVWVCQFRNHNAARHGSIAKHACNSSNNGGEGYPTLRLMR